jgi:hypothetical protein
MALSDDLRKLSERAKQAEDHAIAAKAEARADLERRISGVKASAEAEATKLQAKAETAKTDAAATWNDMQRAWTTHMDNVRADIGRRKAQLDASDADGRADWAEADAEMAIGYAYAAIEEAEYAVLDAVLARREAEEAAAVVSR